MSSHKILKISPPNVHLQNTFNKELGVSKILAQVLVNRGISSVKDAQDFLKPKLEHLLDPYAFTDMHKAVGLIKKAREGAERVMVFGDYDVDGITALTLLKETLSKGGLDVIHHLPHRIKEGYGLNKNILKQAKEKKVKLLITVDCGTSNHFEIEELRR